MKKSLILFLTLVPACLFGQTSDARSQKLLSEMAARFKSYAGVEIAFAAVVTQLQDKSETSHEGTLWLKGEKYKLALPDNIMFFNGLKLYQYLPNEKEVNVTQPDANSDNESIQLLNPQTFFHLSDKTFRSNFVKESTVNHRQVFEIDLYPMQLKTTHYSRIRLCVERNSLQIAGLKAFMKDGTQYSLTFAPYKIRASLPDTFFEFSEKEHPGVEVIDLTF